MIKWQDKLKIPDTEVLMSQERKKNVARPGLEPRVSITVLPSHTFPACLIRFVPESARNHAGTDETVSFRFQTGHQMSQGRNKRGPTGTGTQGLSLAV